MKIQIIFILLLFVNNKKSVRYTQEIIEYHFILIKLDHNKCSWGKNYLRYKTSILLQNISARKTEICLSSTNIFGICGKDF